MSGGTPRAVWEFNRASWWQVQEVNVLGVVHAVHSVVPGMVAPGHGRVVHVGSLIGARSEPRSTAYAGSKASMMCFAEVLAAGDGDALAGTLAHVEDDLDALVARADEIRERGWYALRFVRGLERPEPV